jgi:hypothetical protein
MYLEGKLFFIKIIFLVQELCPKNKILVNLGQLGQLKNFLYFNFFELDFFPKILDKVLKHIINLKKF